LTLGSLRARQLAYGRSKLLYELTIDWFG